MPYPEEHACRLNDPGKYDRFARKNCEQKHNGKCIDVIYGIKSGKSEIQALRYPKKIWEVAAARAHCKKQEGKFEAAKKGNPIMQFMIKSDTGEFEHQQMPEINLLEWFRKNTDEDGNVKKEIVIFQDAICKVADDGAISWVMSDFSVDRDLERMDPAGWDLKNFKKNPIVLWSHDFMRPAIGKVESPRVKDGELVGRVRFSSKEVDPFAAMIEGKVREDIIRTGSVGFLSRKIEILDDPDKPETLIHRKQELFEFSIVNIPSNVNAIASRGMKEYKVKIENILEEFEKSIKELCLHGETWMKNLKGQKKLSYIESLLKQDRHETSGIKHLLKRETKQNLELGGIKWEIPSKSKHPKNSVSS